MSTFESSGTGDMTFGYYLAKADDGHVCAWDVFRDATRKAFDATYTDSEDAPGPVEWCNQHLPRIYARVQR